jgi:hypothetical protein
MEDMKLFSYVLASDDGAAPNPFWGYCTLAICKPKIRRAGKKGDWVVGIGPAGKPTHGKLVYAMRVDEALPLDRYFADRRFRLKKPAPSSRDPRRHVGDNIYYRECGRWHQFPGGTHDHADKKKDTGGKNALVSRHFYYFGHNAVDLPASLKPLAQGGRGHRTFGLNEVTALARWLRGTFGHGVHGKPAGMEGAPCDPGSVGQARGYSPCISRNRGHNCR